MTIPDLPPSQLIPWLRDSIKNQTALLVNLEAVYGGGLIQSPLTMGASNMAEINRDARPTQEELFQCVKLHGGRVNHIADRLNTTEEYIEELLAASGGRVFKGSRGWLKAAE